MTSELNIFDFLKSVVRHRVFIAVFVVIVSIGAVVYSLVAPEYWSSTAVIAVSSDGAMFPGALKGLISGFSTDFGSLAGNEEVEFQTQILLSQEFSIETIKKFDLIHYFELDKNSEKIDSLLVLDDAIEQLLGEVVHFGTNDNTGTIAISAVTKDKYLSKKIVDHYGEMLDRYNREEQISKGRQKREFLEERLEKLNQQLDAASLDLKDFQQSNNIIELDKQISAVMSTFGNLLQKKTETQLQLNFLKSTLTANNPQIKDVQEQIDIIDSQIENLQEEKLSDYLPSLTDVNDLNLKYLKLRMNMETVKNIYESLYPQYELAKLEEINDITTIQYVQRAKIDGKRDKPKRGRICIMAFILAFGISCVGSFIFDLLAKRKEQFKKVWAAR